LAFVQQANEQMIDPTNSVHSLPIDHVSVPDVHDNNMRDATPISSLTAPSFHQYQTTTATTCLDISLLMSTLENPGSNST
jgi:hypothetical protein